MLQFPSSVHTSPHNYKTHTQIRLHTNLFLLNNASQGKAKRKERNDDEKPRESDREREIRLRDGERGSRDKHAHVPSVSWSLMEEEKEVSPQGPAL